MRLTCIKPIPLTDSMLVSTDVTEADYSAYDAAHTYAVADRCIRTTSTTHKIYESLQAGNIGHTPESSPTYWQEVSATNRWKLFDLMSNSATAQSTAMYYRITPGKAVTAVGAVNLTGVNSIRVRVIDPTYGTVYDTTTDLSPLPVESSWWSWFFGERFDRRQFYLTGLPAYQSADVRFDLSGTTAMSVGRLFAGQEKVYGLGIEAGAESEILDYSGEETSAYGDTILTERPYSGSMKINTKILRDEVDKLARLRAEVRATPCLWIADSYYEALQIFGIYKDFTLGMPYRDYSEASLQIKGLT